MYHCNVAPIGMGIGAGAAVSLSGMASFWIVLACWALIACGSALNRIVPKVAINTQGPDVHLRPPARHYPRRPGTARHRAE
jgi:hypothetical protein